MLEGIVTEVHFTNLTQLTVLSANDNKLALRVGPNWVPPFHLKSLSLSNWNVGPQLPSWLQYQHGLLDLDLSYGGISDSIPPWFWTVSSQLYSLNLAHNQIIGELPRHLNVGIQFLYLSSNKFSGPVPQISTTVTELDLSNNSFSGSISFFLCYPTAQVNELRILHLGENHLSGEIPDCWMNWQFLTFINLRNNYLTGEIPSSISHLSSLQSLHLRNNNLVGNVPVSLRSCTDLFTLDLGFNKFDGEMPDWFGSFQNLMVLLFPSNKLEGGIPQQICHLRSLQILDLSENNLSGPIPTCINNLTAMTIVRKSGYTISYSFDKSSGDFKENALVVTKGIEVQYDNILRFAVSMDMSGNLLSGEIPKEITALQGLLSLNLSRNNLTGDIPTNIGDMQRLESVDLSWNQFSGRIPPSMSTMHFLSFLNLSYNKLSGVIPVSTQLQSLNSWSFVGNRLCGPPLTENCSHSAISPEADNRSDNKGEGTKVDEFYLGMLLGFVVGFWAIFGPLLYSRAWRTYYFRFLNKVRYRLCDMFAKRIFRQ